MIDPVQQKLAIRMWNEAVALASHEVQIEALAAENARLKAAAGEASAAPEVDPTPEGDEN